MATTPTPTAAAAATAAAVEHIRQKAEQQNEEEMKNSWPAAFERSVSIISGPILDPDLVSFASEHMNMLPPTKLNKNVNSYNMRVHVSLKCHLLA